MTFTTSKGKYISKGVKEFNIKVINENGTCVDTVKVVGDKKTASNKVKALKKQYKNN